jgi:hypothetical protein
VRYDNFAEADFVYDLKRASAALVTSGQITAKDRDSWLDAQISAGRDYSCVLMMAVISAKRSAGALF